MNFHFKLYNTCTAASESCLQLLGKDSNVLMRERQRPSLLFEVLEVSPWLGEIMESNVGDLLSRSLIKQIKTIQMSSNSVWLIPHPRFLCRRNHCGHFCVYLFVCIYYPPYTPPCMCIINVETIQSIYKIYRMYVCYLYDYIWAHI